MESIIEKILFASIGAVSLTKEKIEDLVDELIKRGQVAQSERATTVRELLDRLEDQSLRAKLWVEQQAREALERLRPNYPSQLDELTAKVNELEAQVQELLKGSKKTTKPSK